MIVVSVRGCARCGGDHDGLVFAALERPMAPSDCPVRWDYWAACPANGGPILLATPVTLRPPELPPPAEPCRGES